MLLKLCLDLCNLSILTRSFALVSEGHTIHAVVTHKRIAESGFQMLVDLPNRIVTNNKCCSLIALLIVFLLCIHRIYP